MQQSTPSRPTTPSLMAAASQSQHGRKLFLAAIILFATLIVVLVRDGQLWFASDDQQAAEDTSAEATTPSQVAGVAEPAARVQPMKNHGAQKVVAPKTDAEPAIVATNRVALPPLNVEVVAGNNRNAFGPETRKPQIVNASASSEEIQHVSQRALPAGTEAPVAETTIVAESPVLAGQMKVQGSVLMQALIGSDGVIQNLRVISGPAILSVAARQAVMQYHFKPYLQDGRAVETSARVTVNFAIRVLGDVTARLGSTSSNGAY